MSLSCWFWPLAYWKNRFASKAVSITFNFVLELFSASRSVLFEAEQNMLRM